MLQYPSMVVYAFLIFIVLLLSSLTAILRISWQTEQELTKETMLMGQQLVGRCASFVMRAFVTRTYVRV